MSLDLFFFFFLFFSKVHFEIIKKKELHRVFIEINDGTDIILFTTI